MRYRFLRFPNGKAKAVTFSYDDGCRYDIRFAETVNRYGIRCTFNINSGFMGNDDRHLSADEIKKYIVDTGHEIAVHGELHCAPGCVKAIDGIRDVMNCRLALEREFGGIVHGMAYPDSGIRRMHNGAEYGNIRRYLSDLGIVYSRTLGGDNNSFELPTDWLAWMPTAHHNNPEILKYIDEFVSLDIEKLYSASRYPRLFYMWGHSYEFEENNNWEHLEDICKRLSGHDDIWYATNIEIYDYVKAFDSLVISADGKTVYNPTLIKVWFDLDGTLYSIDSGETLRI